MSVLSLVLLLVSTYVVCERLSVMHQLAGVVENLVQKSQFTLFWDLVPQNTPPPPENWNLGISWHFMTFQFWPVENTPPSPPHPPPENWNVFLGIFQFWPVENTPPPPENWNLGRSWHFKTFQFWPVVPPGGMWRLISVSPADTV